MSLRQLRLLERVAEGRAESASRGPLECVSETGSERRDDEGDSVRAAMAKSVRVGVGSTIVGKKAVRAPMEGEVKKASQLDDLIGRSTLAFQVGLWRA